MQTFALDLGSYVPMGFERYARVFHPVLPDRRTWASVAAEYGTVAHPDMQLHSLMRSGDRDPAGLDSGSLPVHEATVLVEHLRVATTSQERCWFAVWEGWGTLDHASVEVRLRLPNRAYLLAGAPIDRAAASFLGRNVYHQSASLWWPDDRAWIVATEIDFAWTYVGGTADTIDGLVSDPRIEAMHVTAHHCGSHDADAVNNPR